MHVSHAVRGLLLSASIATSASAAGSWPGEALVAKNSVWLEAGGTTTGNVAVMDAAPGAVLADSAELVVGLGATLSGSARANRVRVRLGGTVDGDVLANALTNLGTVTGSVLTPLALPLPISVPELPAVAPGTADVTLAPRQDLTLTAGAHRNLTLGLGTPSDPTVLTLAGGVYHFESVSLAGWSVLQCAAPCEVRIATRLHAGLASTLGPAPGAGLAPADVQIHVAGINGTTGALGAAPKAAVFGLASTLAARVHTPNGTLWVQAGSAVTGTLVARDLQLGLGVLVAKDAGTACPPSIDDGNACTADSCDPSTGVVTHAPLTGTTCNDYNACTQTDTCQAGACTGANPGARWVTAALPPPRRQAPSTSCAGRAGIETRRRQPRLVR